LSQFLSFDMCLHTFVTGGVADRTEVVQLMDFPNKIMLKCKTNEFCVHLCW